MKYSYTKRNPLVRLAALFGIALLLTGMLSGLTQRADAQAAEGEVIFRDVNADPATELTGKTAAEVVDLMGIGWNIGNTFDATGGAGASHETSWGNPKVTKELIHAVSEAGFNVIRIPITWAQEINAKDNYKIKDEFMARVQEVVDWCYEDNMFVIINVHHEGWLNIKTLDKDYRKIGEELEAVWAQIADHFAEYDQHLIFEGMNEPRMAGSGNKEWTGTKEAYQAVNYLSQVFAQTVRANGKGCNGERCLMIPGYAASSSTNIMSAVTIPTYNGKPVGNVIASVHCYAPYNFCLQDTQMTFGSGDASSVTAIFQAIRSVFLDNGIPVVIGETSATEKGNTEERVKWAECMGKLSQAYGIPIVIWDNGSDSKKGGESHAYINRRTNEWNYPTVVQGLFDGFSSVERGNALKEENGSSKQIIAGDYAWSASGGKAATKEWDASYITIGAKETWFAEGRSVAIVYSGTSEPKLILDSETKQKWWIPVEASRRETLDDKKIVWYDYETVMATLSENGITDPSDLRNFMVVAVPADGQELDLKTYEIVVTGEARITYMVNGQRYHYGLNEPEDPVLDDWVFLGWYTTKTYETEYTKGMTLKGDATVYAMLRLKTAEEIAAEITPTPEPTATPEPTKEPTQPAEPTGTPEADATAAPTQVPDNSRPADEHPSSTGWTIIVIVGIVALIVICAVILKVTNRNKDGKKE